MRRVTGSDAKPTLIIPTNMNTRTTTIKDFLPRVAMTLFLLILTILAPTSKAWAGDDVDYIDEGGTKQTINATKLMGSNSATTLNAGTYYVHSNSTVTYSGMITLSGNVTIILCDGATLNIGTSDYPLSSSCIEGGNNSLTIYGQKNQTGTINTYCNNPNSTYHIRLGGSYTQYGGNVNLNGTFVQDGIYLTGSNKTHTLTRGSLTINNGTGSTAIKLLGNSSHINISGGTLTATSNFGTAIDFSDNTDCSINMSGGVLTVTGNQGISGNVNISGGFLTATGKSCGIWGNVNMSGGDLTATGTNSCGISGNVTSMSGGVLTAEGNQGIAGHVTMSGGFLTATGTNNKGIEGAVNFTGGNFKAIGGSDYAGISGTATLSWSSGYDSFTANKCTVNIADEKKFLDGGGTSIWGNNIWIDGTTTLTPDNRGYAVNTRIDLEVHDDGTGNYWTTFYHPAVGFNISANENGVPTAYIATVSGSKVELTGIEPRGCVPAGQAVIVKTATYGNGKIILTRSDGIDQPSGTNHLKGGASVTPGKVAYTLSRGDGGTGTLGFYKFSGTSLAPYKAHLEIDPASLVSPARGFIGFDDDGKTAIMDNGKWIMHNDESGAWYSLDGRRLSGKPVKKGIYVRNGQKFIVK